MALPTAPAYPFLLRNPVTGAAVASLATQRSDLAADLQKLYKVSYNALEQSLEAFLQVNQTERKSPALRRALLLMLAVCHATGNELPMA